MNKRVRTKKIITTHYLVDDNYGATKEFNSKTDAAAYLEFVKAERKVLSYIKPHGVTLVLAKRQCYFRCIAAFIGVHGVPFCDANKSVERDHFYNGINSIEDHFSSIHGNLVTVLKRAYALVNNRSSFDRWDGAYHYHWDAAVGNKHCFDLGGHWSDGAYWYNWDGSKFTTNDHKCKLTDADFI